MIKKLLLCFVVVLSIVCVFTSCGHEHAFGEWTVTNEPTCTADGLEERTCACGEKETQSVNALGHTEVVDAKVKPTCTATGLTEGKHCSVCKAITVPQTKIDALGHTEVVDAKLAPTCTSAGFTEGKHCLVCKATIVPQTKIDALEHTVVVDAKVDPTCTSTGLTEGKHCSVCMYVITKQNVVEALEHNYVETFPVSMCAEQKISYKCSLCDDSYETKLKSISADIDIMYWGYKDGLQYVQDCIRINKIDGGYGAYTIKITYTNIVGETFTYTENQQSLNKVIYLGDCSWETSFIGRSPKAYAHIEIKDEKGLKTTYDITFPGLSNYTYNTGDNEYSSDITFNVEEERTGHIGCEWIIDTEATCDSEGSKHLTCTNCSVVETDTIPKLSHIKGAYSSSFEKDGNLYSIWKCDRCDDYFKEKADPITANITLNAISGGSSGWEFSWEVDSTGGVFGTHTITFIVTNKYTGYVYYSNTQTSKIIEWESKVNDSYYLSNPIRVFVYVYDEVGSASYTFDMDTLFAISNICVNYEYTVTHSHVYGEWNVVEEATCVTEGTKEKECLCGDKQTESIDLVDHKLEEEYRSDEYGHWKKCEICDHTSAQGEHTVNSDGYCTECDALIQEDTDDTTHSHVYGEWNVVEEATCVTEGIKEKECLCGDKQTESIDLIDHKLEEDYRSNEYSHWKKCENCEYISDESSHISNLDGYCTECNALIEEETEGVIYGVSADGTYAEVIGYEGTYKKVIIAEEYEGLPVKHICDNAFANTNVTEVIIPNGVISIGEYAFYNCYELTSIKFPDTVVSIGVYAFLYSDNLNFTEKDNCKYIGKADNPYFILVEAIGNDESSYTIHPDTKIIACYAFRDCTNATSIEIPSGVNSIGGSAFINCSQLTSINIPDSVIYLGDRALQDCENLTSAEISKNITKIDVGTFYGCESLLEIDIRGKVTSIGKDAFQSCESLITVIFGDKIEFIDIWAFSYCDNIENIYYVGTKEQWDEITIEDGNWPITNSEVIYRYCEDHDFSIVTIQPTCQTGGYDIKTCNVCGKVEICNETPISSINHSFGEWYESIKVTCTNDGKDERVCVCGEKETRPVVAKGHTDGEWITDKEPNCTEDGSKHQICSVCNEVLIAQEIVNANGHTEVTDEAVAPTCTATGLTEGKHCSVCNTVFIEQKIIYAKECNFNDWRTTKVQTGNTEGMQERKCVECGKVEIRSIPTSEPTAIFLESNTLVIKEHEVRTLRPILEPAGSKTKYTFSSSNDRIVTVASAGGNTSCDITGVSAGTATVTITTEYGLSVCCEITVEKTPQPIAIVIPEEIYIKTGEVYHIPIELQPTDSKTLFTISTSDSSIVSANTTGGSSGVCITGISSGEATIVICTSNGISVSSHIIVEDGIEVSDIIIPEEYTLYQGDDWFIPIELNPSDAQTTYSITTTDSSICDVYTTGGETGCTVHAYAVGEAMITIFTENGKTASCKILVLSRS